MNIQPTCATPIFLRGKRRASFTKK